jgi:hypothetical protein
VFRPPRENFELSTSTTTTGRKNVAPELVLFAVNLLLDMEHGFITPSTSAKGKITDIIINPLISSSSCFTPANSAAFHTPTLAHFDIPLIPLSFESLISQT